MGETDTTVTPITKGLVTDEEKREAELLELATNLKSAHGIDEVVALDMKKHGFVVWRAPSQEEYERFQNGIRRSDASHQRKKTTESLVIRQFVAATMIHPTGEAITDLLRKLPALPAVVADKICELVGADDEFDVKKL